ncbi:MAG: hypothetical protein AB7O96_19595 [Pseudobdellovibrionaceae bacterium]
MTSVILFLFAPIVHAVPPTPLIESKIINNAIVEFMPQLGAPLRHQYVNSISLNRSEDAGKILFYFVTTVRSNCNAQLKLRVGRKQLPDGAISEIPEVKKIEVESLEAGGC